MGLGLHGGGVASALYFARRGAEVTVTDLRAERELAPSLQALSGFRVRYVLGRHDERDFSSADLVIKNPAVPLSSPYLKAARAVETDVSVFLRLAGNPVVAVTGSKGKSTTASALHRVLLALDPRTKLGGNITVSPLSFIDEARRAPRSPIVLELSSWQLADLKGKGVLRPRVALLTNLLPDHQNRYAGMEEYADDKRLIFADQGPGDFTLCNRDDGWGRRFARETRGAVRWFSTVPLPSGALGAWLEGSSGLARLASDAPVEIVGAELKLPGPHNRVNLLAAGLAALLLGAKPAVIRERLGGFEGIPHRLQFLGSKAGVAYYNDSAATIPEATAAAVRSFDRPVLLIMGGTDKSLDFAVLRSVLDVPKEIVLVAGSATAKAIEVIEGAGRAHQGPFADLSEAVACAARLAEPGDVVLFSPGAASFELFANEFDRGRRFMSLVEELPG